MTTSVIRKKLVDYLQTADDKKVRALYMMFEDEIETGILDLDEKEFAELESRSKSFLAGNANTFSWEETKNAALRITQNGDK